MAVLNGVEAPDDGPKRYSDGTHRVATPEATLARVLPLAPTFGITRVAVLTGLDKVGIPVAAAYRPNSRSLAVFQGKGATTAVAKVSAVMEAIEAWHAENLDLSARRGRYDELVAAGLHAMDPARLPQAADAVGEDPRGAVLDWVEGRDLFTGAPRWAPRDLVTGGITLGDTPPSPLQATAVGLAAGNHVLEALVHALAEVIERDALALWRLLPEWAQEATVLDAATAPAELRTALLDRFGAAGVALRLFDVTSDIRVPVVLCLAVPEEETDDAVQSELGSGCHPDPAVVLARAVTEAAQVRLTRIAGARDDLDPTAWDAPRRAERERIMRRWLRETTLAVRPFSALPGCAGATLREDLGAMLARLAAAGLAEAVWVDLTRPEVGLPVVRVIVPGLEGPAKEGGGYVPGERARRLMGVSA
jgi:YcaO-like protein with predicted kinase domain